MFTEKGWDQNPQFEGSCMDMELFGFQNIKGNSKEIWITKGFKIWHFPMFQYCLLFGGMGRGTGEDRSLRGHS